jgi:flagellar hook-length control protein FliK
MGLAPDAAGALTPETPAAPLSAQHLGMAGQIEADVGSPAWHQALSQQVMHMRAGHMNQAELQLNPAGLGLLRIKLSLQEQEVNAEFFAAHAQVREALEAALPQLRESLQQGGMALGQAVVTGAQPDQSEAGQSPGFAGPDKPMQGGQSRQGSPGGQGAMDPPPPQRPAPQPFRGTPSDDAALQKPRQGPGQHLHAFA